MENKLWFKAKKYGWGWQPCSWEGWLATLMFVGVIALDAFLFLPDEEVVNYFAILILATVIFIRLAYSKGEKPKWRWGSKKSSSVM